MNHKRELDEMFKDCGPNDLQVLGIRPNWVEVGSKYKKVVKKGVVIDVYDVLKAFEVTNPATQHAIKKLLAGGQRGYKTVEQDYHEAISSIYRAIELEYD